MKNKIKKQTDTKVIFFTMIVASFLAVIINLPFVKKNIINNLYKLTGTYTEEVKEVNFESTGWSENETGSFKVDISSDWISKDEAQVNFEISSMVNTEDTKKDIVLLLDTSQHTSGATLDEIKAASKNLVNTTLSNENNTISVISYDEKATELASFSNDKEEIINKIDDMVASGLSDYYMALQKLDLLLQNYKKNDDRELVVLFITHGVPNYNISLYSTQYQVLKEKYPYLIIEGIQYNMGEEIYHYLKEISDNQHITFETNLEDTLYDISLNSNYYNEIELSTTINNSNFYITDESEIQIPYGTLKISDENNNQVIKWIIPKNKLRIGSTTQINFNLTLNSNQVNDYGFKSLISNTTLIAGSDIKINTSSKNTPVLKYGYIVDYIVNAPSGCNIQGTGKSEIYSSFENVTIDNTKPICDGYQFKGWELTDENITKVNEEEFIMPTKDVELRGTWTKLNISKSIQGDIYERPNAFQLISYKSVPDNISSLYVESDGIDYTKPSSDTNGKGVYILSETKNDEYPIYYYRGAVEDNNVLFANFCWKIIRTTNTGGLKLIYNGIPTDGTCDNSGTESQIVQAPFNLETSSAADVGYMYGTRYTFSSTTPNGTIYYGNDVEYSNGQYKLKTTYQSTDYYNDYPTIRSKYHYTCLSAATNCTNVYYVYTIGETYMYYITLSNGTTIEKAIEEMLTKSSNSTSSNIKNIIDEWYEKNLLNYNEYFEDTIYCNERAIAFYNGWDKNFDYSITTHNWWMYYEGYMRNSYSKKPTLTCSSNDSFTTEKSNGNGLLNYPIGLLTADEASLAGGKTHQENLDYYLNSGEYYWTMTPLDAWYAGQNQTLIYPDGSLAAHGSVATIERGVRPVISIKKGIYFESGEGTVSNPYIIK